MGLFDFPKIREGNKYTNDKEDIKETQRDSEYDQSWNMSNNLLQ
jgi:hypothetical protein